MPLPLSPIFAVALRVYCRNKPGLVAAVLEFLHEHGGAPPGPVAAGDDRNPRRGRGGPGPTPVREIARRHGVNPDNLRVRAREFAAVLAAALAAEGIGPEGVIDEDGGDGDGDDGEWW